MDRKRVPDLLIEQYLLGELPADRMAEVEQSDGFRERLDALQESNGQILNAYPAEQFAKRILNRAERSVSSEAARKTSRSLRQSTRPSLRWLRFALPGVAAAAVAVVLVMQGVFGGNGVVPDFDSDVVRLKGIPEMSIYRSLDASSRSDGSEQLSDGDVAQAGDELQIAYNAGDKSYGMIISIDGRGVLTLHFPLVPSDGPALAVGSTQRLPVAYVLDDAPNFERFYFITSDESFSVRNLYQSIQTEVGQFLRDPESVLDASGDYEVVTFTVRKGE